MSETTIVTETNEQLQNQLIALVEKMQLQNCTLPDNLNLVYKVMRHSDRLGTAAVIRPFITKQQAESSLGIDCEWEGKYGNTVKYAVVSCDDYDVHLENDPDFNGGSYGGRCQHEIIFSTT